MAEEQSDEVIRGQMKAHVYALTHSVKGNNKAKKKEKKRAAVNILPSPEMERKLDYRKYLLSVSLFKMSLTSSLN